ncbi:hypothetical protein Lal_00021999 [Lupinus albus]|nr:hypothetical protein Lal_00021999 [Lupinus albus]
MVSEIEFNFFPVVMGQKTAFSYEVKLTIRLVRQEEGFVLSLGLGLIPEIHMEETSVKFIQLYLILYTEGKFSQQPMGS